MNDGDDVLRYRLKKALDRIKRTDRENAELRVENERLRKDLKGLAEDLHQRADEDPNDPAGHAYEISARMIKDVLKK